MWTRLSIKGGSPRSATLMSPARPEAPGTVSPAARVAAKSRPSSVTWIAAQKTVVQPLRFDLMNAIAAPLLLEHSRALAAFLPLGARREPIPGPAQLLPNSCYPR